jgi:hypothetical protein
MIAAAMGRRKTKDDGFRGGTGTGQRATLPYDRAFVVQFTAETSNRLERAAGRVEHLQTGRRSRFASIDEFVACVAALLDDHTKTSSKRSPVAGRKGRARPNASGDGASSAP